MQRTTARAKRRPLSELNVIDNFLFTTIMNDPEHRIEFSELILSAIFGKKISVLEVRAESVITGPDTDRHGIRMDAYVERLPDGSEKTVIYDVEVETREEDKSSLPRRNRYYTDLLDSHLLAAGENYRELRDLVTIFILSYDPFHSGCMVYQARTVIEDHPEEAYDDGILRLFLYTEGKPDRISEKYGPELQHLLQYIHRSTDDNVVDSVTRQINAIVHSTKTKREVSIEYMKRWELDEELKEDGRREERKEVNALYRWLKEQGRVDDFDRGMADDAYFEKLMEEMWQKVPRVPPEPIPAS